MLSTEENDFAYHSNEVSEQNVPVDSAQDGEHQSPIVPETLTPQQCVRNFSRNWCNNMTNHHNNRQESPSEGTSTEVPSGIDSENEDSESFHSFPPEPLTDESQSGSSVENTPHPGAPRDSGIIF